MNHRNELQYDYTNKSITLYIHRLKKNSYMYKLHFLKQQLPLHIVGLHSKSALW